MGSGFGFFDFEPGSCADLPELLTRLAAKAKQTVGPIDGIVLPECAINESEYEKCARAALAESKFLVCGVKGSGARTFSSNRVRFAIRIGPDVVDSDQELVIGEVDPQPKHHRWMLDGSQIVQYGLGGTLDPTVNWWENIEVGPRRLSFVALEDWLSACVLVCEDLARQDPVADIVRAVGPNLVMALLMDGPQLSSRWAARYATVLADDPGCSVLTLTSLGMTKLSRPPGRPLSRTVGLWKDAHRPEPVEIALPEGCQAVVLNLSVRYGEELTADGRSDGGKTGFPTFAGMHPIAV
jgi:hypothetical protein